ncbi:hypothetical protein VNO77_17151 [Canavalia gladiata]|uniref:Uncharacterized protein n=1 Tax=Canavalia gladiata TaxID=3824 RepID=A0AAN9QGC4_CANGL
MGVSCFFQLNATFDPLTIHSSTSFLRKEIQEYWLRATRMSDFLGTNSTVYDSQLPHSGARPARNFYLDIGLYLHECIEPL